MIEVCEDETIKGLKEKAAEGLGVNLPLVVWSNGKREGNTGSGEPNEESNMPGSTTDRITTATDDTPLRDLAVSAYDTVSVLPSVTPSGSPTTLHTTLLVDTFCLSPCGSTVYCTARRRGGGGASVLSWCTSTGALSSTTPCSLKTRCSSISVSPCGQYLVTISDSFAHPMLSTFTIDGSNGGASVTWQGDSAIKGFARVSCFGLGSSVLYLAGESFHRAEACSKREVSGGRVEGGGFEVLPMSFCGASFVALSVLQVAHGVAYAGFDGLVSGLKGVTCYCTRTWSRLAVLNTTSIVSGLRLHGSGITYVGSAGGEICVWHHLNTAQLNRIHKGNEADPTPSPQRHTGCASSDNTDNTPHGSLPHTKREENAIERTGGEKNPSKGDETTLVCDPASYDNAASASLLQSCLRADSCPHSTECSREGGRVPAVPLPLPLSPQPPGVVLQGGGSAVLSGSCLSVCGARVYAPLEEGGVGVWCTSSGSYIGRLTGLGEAGRAKGRGVPVLRCFGVGGDVNVLLSLDAGGLQLSNGEVATGSSMCTARRDAAQKRCVVS